MWSGVEETCIFHPAMTIMIIIVIMTMKPMMPMMLMMPMIKASEK